MILSDKSIAQALDDGRIGVTPGVDLEQIQPASLDIRIGDTLLDPVTDDPLDTLTAKPGRRYHAYTHSRIRLPNNLSAMMTGRSTYGRRGITVHITAGWVDPGWDGQLLFEMYNLSSSPVTFEPEERIAQLIFFPTDLETKGYSGQYQGQKAPQ